jgi:hypothetical protein
MKVDFVNTGLDLIEGTVLGGILGFGMDIIGGAVASLPNSFLASANVPAFSIVVGALGFVGYAIHSIRKRVTHDSDESKS